MKQFSCALAALLLTACATTPPPAPVVPAPAPAPTPVVQPTVDPLLKEVEQDLLNGARGKFGDVATARALNAPSAIIAKVYRGLPLPPEPQPDGSLKYPDPPLALLVRDAAGWSSAVAGGGWRRVAADKSAALDAMIADPLFLAEPDRSNPTCTDAGASRLLLRTPQRARLIRQGVCGATQRTERLVYAAVDA